MTNIDKDLSLLNQKHRGYTRLVSLLYNIKAGYYRKIQQNEEALRWIEKAIKV
jgi:hypothetical protein